jgi:PAS domain S-box-containing protein
MKFLEKQLSSGDLLRHLEMLNDLAAVSVADARGIITYVNERFCQDCGYSREELIGQSHRILRSGVHDRAFYQELWQTLTSGKIWRGTFCNAQKGGSRYWVRSTISPYFDAQGKVYKYVSIRTDITDQVESSALAKSINQRLDHIVSHISVGVMVISNDDVVCMVNHYLLKLFRLQEDVISGNVFQQLTDFNLVTEMLPYYKQYRRQPFNELKSIIKILVGEQCTWLEIAFQPLLDDNQGLEFTLITINDITQIHQQGIILEQNQRRFDLSQQFAQNGTWEWDIRSNHLYWSAGVAPLFGYAPGAIETSYENFIKAVHPEDREEVSGAIKICLEQGVNYNVEHRVIWPDGQIHWVLEAGSVERDNNENPISMLGVVQLIDQRKQIEQRLTRQRDVNAMLRMATLKLLTPNVDHPLVIRGMLMQMLGNLMAGFAFFDTTTGITINTEELPKLLWVSSLESDSFSDELVPLSIEHQLFLIDWCNLQHEPVIIHDFKQQLQLPRFFHDFGWNNFYFYPLIFANRRLGYLGFINISLDNKSEIYEILAQFCSTLTALIEYIRLSEVEKESYKRLIDSRLEAEKANSAKTDFLASVSHELRTPLNAILGFSELLIASNSVKSSDKPNIEKIFDAGSHLLSLINEMLDLTQIETGNMVFHLENIKLAELVDQCINITRPLADKRSIALNRSDFDYIVNADFRRLKQVIINLISNAIKYNRVNGFVFVKAYCETASEIRLDIEDTGSGINQKDLKKVFEPFERLQHHKSMIEGTGIGLVITRQLIEKMGGRISVTSQSGIGSVFSVWIPLQTGSIELPNSQAEGQLIADVDQSIRLVDSDSCILLVEDNSFNLELLEKQLRMLGLHNLILAEDGQEGIEKWRQFHPTLVFTDINMPRMNGFELLRAIRVEQDGNKHLVIAMTANAMPEEKRKIFEAGFDDYIAKPIILADIRNIIFKNQNTLLSYGSRQTPVIEQELSERFDPSVLRSYVGDDPQTEKLLLNTFLQTAPETLAQAAQALHAGQFEEVRKAAHKLQSSVRAIGFMSLSEQLAELETLASGDQVKAIRLALDATEQLLEVVSQQIKNHLSL